MLFSFSCHIIYINADVDECSENIDSFTCGCIEGYLLDVNGTTCNGMYREIIHVYISMFIMMVFNADIDECSENTDGCSQTCNNTEGSFTCGCIEGYLLDVNGTTCKWYVQGDYTCILLIIWMLFHYDGF